MLMEYRKFEQRKKAEKPKRPLGDIIRALRKNQFPLDDSLTPREQIPNDLDYELLRILRMLNKNPYLTPGKKVSDFSTYEVIEVLNTNSSLNIPSYNLRKAKEAAGTELRKRKKIEIVKPVLTLTTLAAINTIAFMTTSNSITFTISPYSLIQNHFEALLLHLATTFGLYMAICVSFIAVSEFSNRMINKALERSEK